MTGREWGQRSSHCDIERWGAHGSDRVGTHAEVPGWTPAAGRRTSALPEGSCNRAKNDGAVASAPAAALLVLTLGSLLAVAPASADDRDPALVLAPGTGVRIEASGLAPTDVTGTINAIDEKTIRIDVAGHAGPIAIGRDQVTRFRVSAGRGSRLVHALTGAVIGAVAGAVAASHSGGQHYPGTTAAAMSAVALAGGSIGAALPVGERWSDVPVARLRVALPANAGGGFRISFSHGF